VEGVCRGGKAGERKGRDGEGEGVIGGGEEEWKRGKKRGIMGEEEEGWGEGGVGEGGG